MKIELPTKIFPFLVAPPFPETLYVTVPLPTPDCPLVTTIQGESEDTDQLQLLLVLTLNVWPNPPTELKFAMAGVRLITHVGVDPFCPIVTVLPATVIVPVRGASPELGLTLYTTSMPLLDPEKPLVIMIHESLDLAVQGHPVSGAVPTETEPSPPVAG